MNTQVRFLCAFILETNWESIWKTLLKWSCPSRDLVRVIAIRILLTTATVKVRGKGSSESRLTTSRLFSFGITQLNVSLFFTDSSSSEDSSEESPESSEDSSDDDRKKKRCVNTFVRGLHRYHRGDGFNSRTRLIVFFRLDFHYRYSSFPYCQDQSHLYLTHLFAHYQRAIENFRR